MPTLDKAYFGKEKKRVGQTKCLSKVQMKNV